MIEESVLWEKNPEILDDTESESISISSREENADKDTKKEPVVQKRQTARRGKCFKVNIGTRNLK